MTTLETILLCLAIPLIFLGVFFLIIFISLAAVNGWGKHRKNKFDYEEPKRSFYNKAQLNRPQKQSSQESSYIQKEKEYHGKVGEFEVSSVIGDSLPRVRYVFNDALMKLGSKTAQIDHILVNRAGVFVIETKNFTGKIYGNENEAKWVQISNSGVRNEFYNPIMQNESHVKLLREIIGEDFPIFSFIVFVKDVPNVSAKNVIHISELRNKIIETSLKINLSSDEIMQVASMIKNRISHSSVDRANHINSAKQTASLLEAGRCPRCHKKLVLRKKPYGDFWECGGAPNCSYTRKIDKT